MKLLPRLGIILTLVLMPMAGASYLALRADVLPKFEEVELRLAERDSHRVLGAIENELRHLSSAARDWALRDDSYQFARDGNPEFVETALNSEALASLGIDALGFYGADGQPLWSADALRGPGTRLTEEAFEGFAASGAERSGIVATPNGPALVVVSPIVAGASQREAAGSLVMAKVLDAPAVQALSEQTQASFRFLPPPADFEPSEGFAERASADPTLTFAERGEDLLVHTYLIDEAGLPAALVELTLPRDVMGTGADAVEGASLDLVLVGILALLIVGVLVGLLLVKPIMRLTRHIVDVARTGDLRRRSSIERSDEIGILAQQFDSTLDQLADGRELLLEQSYYSGVAEMMTGVVHNIRNAINPLIVHFWALRTIINGHSRSFRRAIEEIADAETPPDRRSRLIEFLRLAADQQHDERQRIADTCDLAASQFKQVEEILQYDQDQGGQAKLREPVDLKRVVDDAAKVLLGKHAERVELVTAQLAASNLPPVLANRIVLTQVIGNLLINAAESIEAAGRAEGSITVAARFADGFVHLLVADNGEGFDQARQAQLFRRGYSTRENKQGGLGLRWCANSVSAMGGRISLDSKGPGSGATAHLHLPAVASRIEEMAA